jgi:hypothetical protein
MAARSRPFCKHAAALMVAWAKAPESFAVSDAAPAGMGGDGKKREVKKGKTDSADLMKHGVEQIGTLVRELASAGIASLAAGRSDQVRALGEGLRENRLRRLSARTLDLSKLLAAAATDAGALDSVEYADLLSDLLLTAKKLEKHLGGEALDDKYVEELIGKTWTKKDRKPVSGLDLVEYAFISRVTSDDFVIRESRFVDLLTGEHYAEKQIIPGFLAKRTDPKPSYAGRVLAAASGSLYPSFAPVRIDLETPSKEDRLSDENLERLLAKAHPNVAGALAAFQERRKDVFAPDLLPVAIAVDTVLAEGARMQVVDKTDAALFLPDDQLLEERLAAALRSAKLEGLLGDIALDGALPTLFPLAALVRGPFGLELRHIGAADASLLIGSRKVRAGAAPSKKGRGSAWTEAARAAGASSAAISLAEVREELAGALMMGLGALVPRLVDPLADRLRDLRLDKQAELLAQAAQKPEPADRLDDLVKVFQILGIALTRLAGASHVDRAELTSVPTYESVQVRKADRVLEPREVAALSGQGKLNRYQAAVHYASFYASIPAERLAESIYPTWADGSASPYVARAFEGKGAEAVSAAQRALGLEAALKTERRWYRPHARVARLTAIRVLEAVATKEAEALLGDVARGYPDAALRSHAQRALRAISARGKKGAGPVDDPLKKKLDELRDALLSGSTKEKRIGALRKMVELAHADAIPYIRASFYGDISGDVREEAAYALGRIGDVESVDTFVRMLRARANDNEQAKIGAYALGYLGDVRGLDELLAAYAEGWQPGIVADAIRQIGTASLEPLIQLIEEQPEIASRKAALGVIGALEAKDVAEFLAARLDQIASHPKFVERAAVILTVAAVHPEAGKACAKKVLALKPGIGTAKDAPKEEKALATKAKKMS